MRTFKNYREICKYIVPINHADPDYKTHCQIQNTFKYLEDYLNITTNQYIRVERNIAELELLPNTGDLVGHNLLIFFGDIHFMFIVLEKVYKLSFRLLKLLGKDSLYKEFSNSPAYITVKQIRNCLEHMDENLTNHDSRFNECILEHSNYTNWFSQQWGMIIDDEISLGKYSFSLNENSFSPTWHLYDIILDTIHTVYVTPNKKLYDKILRF